ncbi:MAG: bifunctional UDP-sugar hydrolase/5'-nucleotidase [Bacteroidales bacterium]
MIKSVLYRSISLLVLTACQFFSTGYAQKTPQKIILLHTNDMHSKIDNMAKLAYLKDSLLKACPLVFLVSAGDNFTGNPVVDMIEEKGYPMIDLMNDCKFDLSAIGNHEFDMGQEFLNKRIAQADFPFISCNTNSYKSKFIQPRAFHILSSGDSIHLAFLGVIQLGQNGLPDTHPLRLEGMRFVDGVTKAQEYSSLKERYGNLIVLSHLGVETDKALAAVMPQIDLIIGGHSHTLIEKPMRENGVMITQAGYNLKWIGKTTLTLLQGKIIDQKDEIIPSSVLKSEVPSIRQKIDQYNDNEEFNRILGVAAQPLVGYAQLGSLMTDAVRDAVKVDIVFQNRGGIRIDSLGPGPIRVKDVYKLDPFANQVALCKMSADEIKGLICAAFNMNNKTDLEVSGIKYTVYTAKDGKCVQVELIPDNPGGTIKNEYLVAMNSYIASAYTFTHANEFQIQDITTSQILIDYITKTKTINYQGVKRNSTIPAN